MRFMNVGLACLAVFAACTSPAEAGLIFLSGDANIGNGIDGSAAATGTPGNATFFSNILGSGSSVLIHDELGVTTTSVTLSSGSMNTFYGSLSGVSSTLVYGDSTISGASLTGVDLLISMLPASTYAPEEISAIADLLSGGGSVFFMGDWYLFADENARINAALSALGSSMFLGAEAIGNGFETTPNIDADSFTFGITSFEFAATNTVSGGTSLIRTDGDEVFIAYENSVVPEPGSIAALLSLAGCGVGALVFRRRRAKKLAA